MGEVDFGLCLSDVGMLLILFESLIALLSKAVVNV